MSENNSANKAPVNTPTNAPANAPANTKNKPKNANVAINNKNKPKNANAPTNAPTNNKNKPKNNATNGSVNVDALIEEATPLYEKLIELRDKYASAPEEEKEGIQAEFDKVKEETLPIQTKINASFQNQSGGGANIANMEAKHPKYFEALGKLGLLEGANTNANKPKNNSANANANVNKNKPKNNAANANANTNTQGGGKRKTRKHRKNRRNN